MKYIIAGILLSFGWHIVKIIYEIIEEILFCRLHNNRCYKIITGKEKRVNTKGKDGLKMKIGF